MGIYNTVETHGAGEKFPPFRGSSRPARAAFIAYQAKRAGVPVVHVDPAYTSQECAQCHHTARHNRPSQGAFACKVCGFVDQRGRWAAWAEPLVPAARDRLPLGHGPGVRTRPRP
ncbi:zinc ribbon domain-containing protein [Streptomyces sp. NPDC094437]|uniref:zinc ribbon domain-containing protein n=1 Tax=Streptomyces sp. NPDC094437 TaxID=3366060 RepID=UPI0038025FEC